MEKQMKGERESVKQSLQLTRKKESAIRTEEKKQSAILDAEAEKAGKPKPKGNYP